MLARNDVGQSTSSPDVRDLSTLADLRAQRAYYLDLRALLEAVRKARGLEETTEVDVTTKPSVIRRKRVSRL